MESHLEKLVTCSVCLGRFKKPKILPCQHTFCLTPCLSNLVTGKTLKCPHCRRSHNLCSGVAGLPNNLTIVSILELPAKNVDFKKENNCQGCSKDALKLEFCQHCDSKLCSECSAQHSQQIVQSLSKAVEQSRKISKKCSEKMLKVENKKGVLKSNSDDVKREIKRSFNEVFHQLKKRQEDLLSSLHKMTEKELNDLQMERENLEMELSIMTSQCHQAHCLCNHLSQVLSFSKKLDHGLQNKAMSMMSQHKEHLNNFEVIENHLNQKLRNRVEFSKSSETLMSSVSRFGEITFHKKYFDDIYDVTMNGDTSDIEEGIESLNFYVPSFPSDNSTARSSGQTPGFSRHLPSWARFRGSTDGESPTLRERATTLEFYRNKGLVKKSFGLKGSAAGCLNWPRGVAISPQHEIVVADSSNHRVQVFANSGENKLVFGGYGHLEAQLDCLAGVHATAQGWIIVADRYNHRLQIFDSRGRFIRMFGQEGSGEGDLSYPWGVATDNMGFVFVCDKDNHRVQVFALDGRFVRKFGRLGSYDGQFDSPHYVALTRDSKVIVSDTGNHRVQIFDKYGRFLLKFGHQGSLEGELKHPLGVAVDRHGNVLVVDAGNDRVQIFGSRGSFVALFGGRGSGLSQLRDPEGIGVMEGGEIVVSDRGNHRIQIY